CAFDSCRAAFARLVRYVVIALTEGGMKTVRPLVAAFGLRESDTAAIASSPESEEYSVLSSGEIATFVGAVPSPCGRPTDTRWVTLRLAVSTTAIRSRFVTATYRAGRVGSATMPSGWLARSPRLPPRPVIVAVTFALAGSITESVPSYSFETYARP